MDRTLIAAIAERPVFPHAPAAAPGMRHMMQRQDMMRQMLMQQRMMMEMMQGSR